MLKRSWLHGTALTLAAVLASSAVWSTDRLSLIVPDGSSQSLYDLAAAAETILEESRTIVVDVVHRPPDALTELNNPSMVLISSDQLGAGSKVDFKSLEMLALLAGEYHVMVVSTNSRYSAFADLVDQLRENPKEVNWLLDRNSSASLQLGIADIARRIGVKPSDLNFQLINSSEPSAAVAALDASSVTIAPISSVKQDIEEHKLKALGITGSVRENGFEVPTFDEQGLRADSQSWTAVMVSSAISAEERERLAALVKYMTSREQWREVLDRGGWHNQYAPSDELGAFIETEQEDIHNELLQDGLKAN
ncbi:Bug family tripartite tricarboxylate transporter substrate binding protein [Rhizobium acaciae]|uniref:Bug family tripartite tricarboxylate transporter substrate binding protein n=1 Tax=Rhizobium acaciae TaxID=2989736 RepID=UPI00221FB50B|nr:tripartite tricarboxylate transporter substrate-binding protein [Rhizobium acaciae]MCW1750597.1 tripartite tricarboxylate transporter substrate-binding protein [Rhizobium acaciae]